MNEWKWLQVRLPGELHQKFAGYCLQTDVGMSEVIREWIENAVNAPRKTSSKAPPVTVVKSIPSTGEYTGVCSQCGAVGVRTTINKNLKSVCYPCAGV